MRITNIILTILFIVFAIVQYNDPDPWLWIGIYLFMTIMSGLAASNRFPSWVLRGGMLGCIIGLAMLLPDFIDWLSTGAESITQSMKAEEPHIELTREFLGLLFCTMTLGFLLWQGEPKGARK